MGFLGILAATGCSSHVMQLESGTVAIPSMLGLTEPESAKQEQVGASDEESAFQQAKPAFERFCTPCHTTRGAASNPEAMEHMAMDSHPFGGHHAAHAGDAILEALGRNGVPATMPPATPGAVQGSELEAIVQWAHMFERSASARSVPAGTEP